MSESGSPPAGAKSRRMSRTIASGLHTLSEHSCRPITGHLCVAQYQQLAGQRAILEQLSYLAALTFGQAPGPRMAISVGERVIDHLDALASNLRDRRQVGCAQPLLHSEGGLVDQLDEPVGRRKVVVLKLIARNGAVSHEGE